MIINCNYCNKSITDVDENKHIGIQIEQFGGIYKLPILFGRTDSLYFCSKECNKSYYEENFDEETRGKAKAVIKKMREELPETSRKIAEDMSKLVNTLNIIKNGTV